MERTRGDILWDRAHLALSVLAVDPIGVGGLWLRARTGPVRDTFMVGLKRMALPLRRIHPDIGEDQLFGGLDLSTAMAEGRILVRSGLLSGTGALVLTVAERCPDRLAAHLAQTIDKGTHPVVALDEGAASNEIAPASLTERLGLFVSLDDIPARDSLPAHPRREALTEARGTASSVAVTDAQIRDLVAAAAHLNILSLRAPMQAIAATRALAALDGRLEADEEDIRMAAALVYSHRATFPDGDDGQDDQDGPEPPEDAGDGAQMAEGETRLPEEILVEAARAALPPDILTGLAEARAARQAAGQAGSGARKAGNRTGRPIPPRTGRPESGNRIDMIATLRAAAPWQTIRARDALIQRPVHFRAADIRIKRYEERSDRLLIFAVDASGSLALSRLGEAKGAVEILLAEAYQRRDHVALVAFRGGGAELLLPPTRSLVQTKKRLRALPGGGGTPLAAGLQMAMVTARQAAARGMTPTIALLTDGRANIALSGDGNRSAAREDAGRMADLIRAEGIPSLVLDTARRPAPELRGLSDRLAASYIVLPRADARGLSDAVTSALGRS